MDRAGPDELGNVSATVDGPLQALPPVIPRLVEEGAAQEKCCGRVHGVELRQRMRLVVAEVIVERQRDGKRPTPMPGGNGDLKVCQLHKPVETPQMSKLARKAGRRHRRDKFVPAVAVPVSDIVVEQDEPGAAIRASQQEEQGPPQ
jgi:hypothetical protein